MYFVAFQDVAEQVAAIAKISHYEKHIVPFPDFSDVKDIRVIELGEDLVLAHKSRHI